MKRYMDKENAHINLKREAVPPHLVKKRKEIQDRERLKVLSQVETA